MQLHGRVFRVSLALVLAGALLASGCQRDSEPGAQSLAAGVPLLEGLATRHHAITTDIPGAQRYFDQGVRLVYAFNHAEAIRRG